MSGIDWKSAKLVEKLRDRVETHKRVPPSPPMSPPTAEDIAYGLWDELIHTMWDRASNGCNSVRLERYVLKEHSDFVEKYLKSKFEGEGFEYRDEMLHQPNSPLQGTGCFYVMSHPLKSLGTDGEVVKDEKTVDLVVTSSWQTSGWCLSCGQRHIEDIPVYNAPKS